MGLREIKKQQTRTAIADAALPLFLERGFDQVTVAEVARHAGVSTNTVFNYFPAKEDLFFDRQAEVENHLAALVRDRTPGTCPVEVVRDDLLSALRQDDPMLGAPSFWQVIEDSPALRAREREIGERIEAALATALASDTPGDAPPLIAGAIAGTHRAALRELRRRIVSGQPPVPARDAVASAALQAFSLLCSGLHTLSERQSSGVDRAVMGRQECGLPEANDEG